MADQDGANSGVDRAEGATVSFPYDRMTVEQFRQAFPRARWDDERKAWYVPGKTASARFERWQQRQSSAASAYADDRGRDAFAFDPIQSPYLQVRDGLLEISTPFSRTVVGLLREIPFAAWDGERKLWTVPFRSYDALRKRWDRIEEAARRNEPEQRKARQAQKRGTEQDRAARARATERRRRRYPLDPDDLPPLERPVMTAQYGIVVFERSDGELVAPEALEALYGALPAGEYVWGYWRPAQFDELIRTWPAKASGKPAGQALWWQPTIDELRVARKAARRRAKAPTTGTTDVS